MTVTTTTLEDGKISIAINHKGIIDTRVIDPVVDEDGTVNADASKERVSEVADAVKVKIDLGIITKDTVAMATATPYVHVPFRSKDKPE